MVGASDVNVASGDRIRVVLGGDCSDARRALYDVLVAEPDIEVVGVADDGETALHLLRSLRPDVALLDEDMTSFGGGAVARVLASELPDLQVVVLTAPEREEAWTST
ncbi:MAG TPA: response regulator [Candidatus Limnocylindria bacterium]|jgi:DNA-binding NarL/FixJ family response regulator|nr:response regulator [Candidatus Limnocylindria bacterium]